MLTCPKSYDCQSNNNSQNRPSIRNLVKFEESRLRQTEVNTQHVCETVQHTIFQRVKSHNSGTTTGKIVKKYTNTRTTIPENPVKFEQHWFIRQSGGWCASYE